MAWQVSWTEAAQDDLNKIASYIAEDYPHYAAAFVREALEAAQSLTHMDQRGHMVPEWRDSSIRELLLGNYRLIYQLVQPVVAILSIVHGARDLETFWKEGHH